MRKKLLVIRKVFVIVLSVFMIMIGIPQVKATSDYMEIIVNDAEVGDDVNQFTFSNGWVHEGGYPDLFEGGDEHWTTKAVFGENYPSFSLKFLGNKVTLYGHRVNDGCIGDVYIDDVKVDTIDFYRNGRLNKDVLYQSPDLENTLHTIKVVLNGDRNENAGMNYEAAIDYALIQCENMDYPATGIQLSDAKLRLEEGMQKLITAKVLPSYATQVPDIIWESEDPSVASVDQTGLIKAVNSGTTSVVARLEGTDISSSVVVSVVPCINEITAIVSDNNKHAYPERYLSYLNDLYDKDLSSLQTWTGYAWRNDEVTSRIDIFSKSKGYKDVRLVANDFVDDEGNIISKENIKFTYMDKVIAHTSNQEIFDVISHETSRDLEANQMYAAWVAITVPEDAKAGVYTSKLSLVSNEEVLSEFTYQIEVLNLVVPELQSQIELWMYPYSSNRYYSGLSSSEYFGTDITDLYYVHLDNQYQAGLESQLELYRKIGGDAITVTVVEDAWNSQTHDPYPSMVKWTRKADGTFSFDYTDMDKWIELCMKHGIDKQIKAFSLSCWGNRITYFDEKSNQVIFETPATNSERWKELWTIFLQDYVKHMDEKGWFDITYMSMDERPLSEVIPVLDLVESVKNKDGESLKTSVAVFNYETEPVFDRIDDLSFAIYVGSQDKAKEITKQRKEKGLMTTIYTCGGQNSAILNNPGESTASIYESYKDGTQGFLRWAFDSFNADPLITSQHDLFAAGDLYLIYPDLRDANYIAQSTPRFEKLVEGARDIEKLRYLTNNYDWMIEDIEGVVNKLGYDIPAAQNLINKLSKQALYGPIIPSISINEKDVELFEDETIQLTISTTPDDLLDDVLRKTEILNDFDSKITYSGTWSTDEGYPNLFYNGDDHWCAPNENNAGDYGYEFDFYGDSFAIIGNLEYLNGKFDIYIDDNYTATVDAYSDGRVVFSRLYESDLLELKTHHVVVKGNGTKNAASTAYNMQLDYIETYIHEKLVWTSSDDQIVSVEDGLLTAHKTGEANITVTGGEYSDTISVKVKAKANKTALKIALDLANAITDEDLKDIIPAVADEFKAARDEANAVYNDTSATQAEVNNAFDRLASAMHMLDFIKGDKTALKAFIDKVSGLEADKYTEDTWTAFETELSEAKAVYKDENAMQEEVNNAYSELVTAFLNLRLIPDKSLLEELINQAEGLNGVNYTKATFDGLTKALNEAKAVFENPNASQVEVDNAKDVLAKAIAGLQTVTTDNTVSTPVNNDDTTASVKTGDGSLAGMFATIALLSVAGYTVLRRKEN